MNKKDHPKDLVVKSNKLVQAIQSLSLSETRLLQLAIVDARESQRGLTTDKPLVIDARRYADAFGVTLDAAYLVMIEAEDSLFKRQFTIEGDDGKPVKSRWIQDTSYRKGEGRILVTLTRVVVQEITRIDGFEKYFTQYRIEQTAHLSSVYAVRLYELLIQWSSLGATPIFKVELFRDQIGLGANEYGMMSDFKKRVLDLAVKQINEHTDIKVDYEQHKQGRTITGFSFKFKYKKAAEKKIDKPKKDTKVNEPLKNTWNTPENTMFKSLYAKCPTLTKNYVEELAKVENQSIHDLLTNMYMEHSKADSFELEP